MCFGPRFYTPIKQTKCIQFLNKKASHQLVYLSLIRIVLLCILVVDWPVCEKGEWQCDNQRCIPETSRCDVKTDCTDGSDEKQCGKTSNSIRSDNNIRPSSSPLNAQARIPCHSVTVLTGYSQRWRQPIKIHVVKHSFCKENVT